MSSNKKIDASEILGFSSADEKFEFEVSTLHFDFIDEIQKLMDKRPMKNKELAKALNVSESFISQLFTGEKMLNFKILTKIQKVLNVRFRLSTGEKQTSQQIFVFVAPKNQLEKNKNISSIVGPLYSTNESFKLNLVND